MAYDRNEVQAYVREAAQRRGIDPEIALRVVKQESAFNPLATNLSPKEKSYGLMQLNTQGGLGVHALEKGINIRDPNTWREQVDFGLDVVAKDGWRQWYGARDVGIGRWDGIGGRKSSGPAAPSGGGRSPLTEAVADRGMAGGSGAPTLAGGAGGDQLATGGSGPVVNIGLPSEREGKAAEAMIAAGNRLGSNAQNGWDAIGGLAQVWAGNRMSAKAEAGEASALQKAIAGLDPEYAMAAQLMGGREGAAQAIMSQNENRTAAATRAEARADRLAAQDYERSQDSIANERASATLDLQREAAENGRLPPGYRRTETGMEAIPGGPADPAVASAKDFRTMTPEEVTARGLPAGQYQVGPNDRVYPIGDGKGSSVTVVNADSGSGAFYKKADESRATSFVDMANEGTAAQRRMLQVDQLEKLLGNVETGGLARMKQIAGQWGINTEKLDDIQAASSLIDQMVPSQRPPGSGTMSDADLALFKSSLPQIINQPGGNKTIIQTMRGIANYDQQMGAIANRVLNREIDPGEGQRLMATIENPLARFREAMPAQRDSLVPGQDSTPRDEGGVPTGGASSGQSVARPTSDAEYSALPSGALFVDPDDGKTYRKP